jgi:acyl carrier protein
VKDADIRAAVMSTLRSIAPEIEDSDLKPERSLRQQVDLDSMDWLRFLVGLHEKLGVQIPETDYARLVTLRDLVAYLAGRLNRGA